MKNILIKLFIILLYHNVYSQVDSNVVSAVYSGEQYEIYYPSDFYIEIDTTSMPKIRSKYIERSIPIYLIINKKNKISGFLQLYDSLDIILLEPVDKQYMDSALQIDSSTYLYKYNKYSQSDKKYIAYNFVKYINNKKIIIHTTEETSETINAAKNFALNFLNNIVVKKKW